MDSSVSRLERPITNAPAIIRCSCSTSSGIWNAAPEVYGYLEGEGIKYAIRRNLFADIPRLIAELRPPPATSTA
jgi:hypothetical protein